MCNLVQLQIKLHSGDTYLYQWDAEREGLVRATKHDRDAISLVNLMRTDRATQQTIRPQGGQEKRV